MKTVYHEAMHPLGNLGLKIPWRLSKARTSLCTGMTQWKSCSVSMEKSPFRLITKPFCFPATSWSFLTLRRCIPSSLPLLFICFYAFMWTKSRWHCTARIWNCTTSNVSHCRWITPSQQNTLRSVSLPVTSPVPVLKKKAPAPCARMVSLF